MTPPYRIPLKTKFYWGCGGMADNFMMSAVVALILPIYNIGFGVSAIWLGIATAIPRFLDAFVDPWMGNVSDNTQSRWGRRRPYMLGGLIVCSILFPLLWMPPFESEVGRLSWFFTIYVLFTLAYTAFIVPYTALGIELTTDYDERTRVMAWRMFLGLIVGGLAVPWLYKLSRLDAFGGSETAGIRVVGIGVGLAMLISGLPPALLVKERPHVPAAVKVALLPALRVTFSNRPFLILLVAYVFILVGLFIGGSFGLYVNIYHAFGGNKDAAATMIGWSGSVTAGAAYLSLFLATWVATHFGKRTAMLGGLAIGVVGGASMWFTINPVMPYAQLGSAFLLGLGLQGCWLMVSSMTADICDLDELESGLQREGLYSAVVGCVQKLAFALIAVAGGVFLRFSGYVENIPPGVDTVFRMRLFLVGFITTGLVTGFFMILRYPITRQRAEEVRCLIDARKQA